MSVVKYFSDYVGVMNQGKLVEEGTPEEIYSNPVHPYTKALLSAIPVPDPEARNAVWPDLLPPCRHPPPVHTGS